MRLGRHATEWKAPADGYDWLRLIVRVGIGGVFVYLGLQKAFDPVAFLKVVREYDLTTTPWLLNGVAALLPWLEVFCGLLLIAGLWVTGSALVLAALLLGFTGVVVHRALEIHAAESLAFCAIQFDCGCGAGTVFVCNKLVENAVLWVGAVWLLAAGRRAAPGRETGGTGTAPLSPST